MKILIVDDNELARQMVRRYLRGAADDFRECDDGAKALAAYAEFMPDWVLMDWEMKQVNGLAATQNIIADYPQAKILIVTNHDEKYLRRAAADAGATGFVSKFDLFLLRSLITKSDKH